MVVGTFFYDASIPTSAVNSFYFRPMLDVISIIGLEYKGSNYYQLRVNLLKDVKKEVQLLVNSYDEIWAKVGMVIEWVGPLNVVHVVTNNATNYVAIGRLISQKYKHINWSLCAIDCLNLIFKHIGKMDHVVELIFRPDATCVATTFIALKSFHDHKHDLQALVTSKFFVDFRYSRDNKSRVAFSIILDNRFWNNCLIVVNLMVSVVHLLHIVDCDERPSMGYVYEGMFYNKKRTYDPINYACIDETNFWIVDEDEPEELDIEELENILYEEVSIPINEVEGSSSHIDDEDGGGMTLEGLDVENFGFSYIHFESSYPNYQHE
uniref:DUF659 domain-containing protein n=1 Tax=Vitis vinifera TaxID=29760 RepID=A5BPE8_VITVI|nr:hypothetical protein VITISV_014705 [Vitis vinifera]